MLGRGGAGRVVWESMGPLHNTWHISSPLGYYPNEGILELALKEQWDKGWVGWKGIWTGEEHVQTPVRLQVRWTFG